LKPYLQIPHSLLLCDILKNMVNIEKELIENNSVTIEKKKRKKEITIQSPI